MLAAETAVAVVFRAGTTLYRRPLKVFRGSPIRPAAVQDRRKVPDCNAGRLTGDHTRQYLCRSLFHSGDAMLSTLLLSIVAATGDLTFDAAGFSQLRFLEGRWKGQAPDGSAFYEQYDFPTPTTLRSRRFPDDQFKESTDSSSVALENGQVISRWGEFSWKAVEISDGKASFAPVNAPSSFSWERAGSTIKVTQRWTGEDGKENVYSLILEPIGKVQ
jgi:hypothetical protein